MINLSSHIFIISLTLICSCRQPEESQHLSFDLDRNTTEINTLNTSKGDTLVCDSLIKIGRKYGRDNNFDSALIYFNKAISIESNYYEAIMYRSYAHRALEKYEKYIEDLGIMIKLRPNEKVNYHDRGLAWHLLSEYNKAIEDYSFAISIDQNNIDAYTGRGVSYHAIKRYTDALNDYNFILSIDNTNAKAYYNKATLMYEIGRKDVAIELLDSAIYHKKDYQLAIDLRNSILGK